MAQQQSCGLMVSDGTRRWQESPGVSIASRQLRPAVYGRLEARPEMLAAANSFEHRFKVEFSSLSHFPKDLLDDLQAQDVEDDSLTARHATIASQFDRSIVSDMAVLSDVANTFTWSRDDRRRYFEALKKIYAKLPNDPGSICRRPDTLCVGVEREGRILGRSMRWLPQGPRGVHPHGKRVPFDKGGLLIGLTEFQAGEGFSRCAVIDGAIATGATVIALIDKLQRKIPEFYVYSVHGTFEGIRAITKYAAGLGVKVSITVGHATSGLDPDFYAVDPSDNGRLVVGDLGDTISDPRGRSIV